MEQKEYFLEETSNFIEGMEKHSFSGQKKLLAKIISLLEEIRQHPTTGTGQVEPLRGYGERSVFSRRIDQKHRLVYEIFEQESVVKILSAYGHYEE